MNLTQAFKTLQSELTKLKTKAERDKLNHAENRKQIQRATVRASVHLMIGKAAKRRGKVKLARFTKTN